ncbi:MAG: U32 family peptidase [Lachnospiraceae bacterium]|nr:U32 family peptidase [Lachnospiraceae bacterium]
MTGLSKKPELLAPAGNKDAFMAVLRAGADAVYLAGNKYGARAYADNFSEEELCSCIRYAHLYNKRVYLTVNTLVTDTELDELFSFLKPMYEVGLDGVIVQDLGVIAYIRKNFPMMEVHASTQLNTTGIEGVDFIKKMGVCRVVPARELSLNEIKTIKAKSDIELECFIHGAICYCYSGQCLFSSVIGSRSGNRGRCAQPCRLPYSHNNQKDIYPLSLKDMCTIEYLPKLIEAGIDSFKIEGRMKKPEYAAGVTAMYRKYIDQYFAKGEVKVTDKDKKILSSLYIRSQISEGYYEKYNGKDMITLGSPSYSGSDENIINNVHSLYVGDSAKNTLPKYKIDVTGCFITGEPASITVSYEDIFITKYGDEVQSAQKRPITSDDVLKQINKLGSTNFVIDELSSLENIFVSEDAYYNLKGINELRRAALSELEEKIIESFGLIYSRECGLENSGVEYTDSRVNICADYIANDSTNDNNLKKNKSICNANEVNTSIRQYSVLINDKTQLKNLLEFIAKQYLKSTGNSFSSNTFTCSSVISKIYVPEELFINALGDIDDDFVTWLEDAKASLCNDSNNDSDNDYVRGIEFLIAMPYVRRMQENKTIAAITSITDKTNIISGFLVRNIEDLNTLIRLKDVNNNFEIVTDYGVYAWNRESINKLSEYASAIGLPLELCGAAQRDLHKHLYNQQANINAEKLVYGRLPLMHTANCINKTLNKCIKNEFRTNENKWTKLTDRTKRDLPVFTDCVHCQNTIYNTVPVTLTKELKNNASDIVFRLDFTNENNDMMNKVLDYYIAQSGDVNWEYTKGFEKHSTE